GFFLSGLRRMGHQWGAIILTSVFFGLAHGILQQSLGAAAIGIFIGYLAVKTGSLLPGVLYHAVHNGLSVMVGRITPDFIASQPLLRAILQPGADSGDMTYRWPAILAAACLSLAL